MKEYNVKELAEIFYVTVDTVRRWIRDGKIEAVYKDKNHPGVSRASLRAFLEKNPKLLASLSITILDQMDDFKIGITKQIDDIVYPIPENHENEQTLEDPDSIHEENDEYEIVESNKTSVNFFAGGFMAILRGWKLNRACRHRIF